MVNEWYDGYLSAEAKLSFDPTDFMEQIADITRHDLLVARAARLAGAEAMRLTVLEWAYSFKDALSDEMLDALYERMLKRAGELRDGTRQAEGEGR